jgi:hypothetical protein
MITNTMVKNACLITQLLEGKESVSVNDLLKRSNLNEVNFYLILG